MSVRYLLLNQLKYLAALGHDVTAVCGPGRWVSEVRDMGIDVVTVPMTRQITPLRDLGALSRLLALFARVRPQIVHTHTPKATLLGQWSAFLARVPHRVHTIHGLYFPGHMKPTDRWRYVWLERLQMSPAHLVFSQNPEDIETCRRDRICNPSRIRFLGNGIDLQRFHPRNAAPERKQAVRATLGIPEGDSLVGMVGRLVREKGYLEYFAAARTVLQRLPRSTFLAIGPHELWKPDAVTPADAADLGERVRFLGHRDDMADLYGAMDLLVLPSHREGFPRAPMEAAATGIPVIATDIRGCREVVVSGVTGRLVPLEDAPALAMAMVELLGDEAGRMRMGTRARKLAEEKFDERAVFARTVEAYEELIGARALGTF